uniref:Knr4/Smi1-like domain-containing protein n=1 Tax=Globisporangium ultimum (strain ATCC 200006 / CBS 805.95 / DAOM BR144) TaxID=431595 RepID=K3WTV4_GLOUD
MSSSNAGDDHKQEEEIDLDDLLDDALDDFSDELSNAAARTDTSEVAKVREEAESTLKASEENEMEQLKESMSKFLEDAQNPEFQQVLEQAFRELGTNADGENIESLLGSLSAKNGAAGGGGNEDDDDDVSIGVAKTLQNMAKAAEDMEGMESAKLEEMGEEMMEEMMKKFESMGEKSDFQDLVDGMMQQLLSKDVMYDPMKQICERYPEWLAEKESLLSKEDYERYGKQYQYFQQIIAVYESEPDNFARLSELMQEMQETGQPPSEIVKDLAPGLQFDDEGMPIMPNMGPGMIPGMAGMPGMPLGVRKMDIPGTPGVVLSQGMQHLDAISMGVLSYLQAHKHVSHVEPKEMVGASAIQLAIWEQKNFPCILPDDFKRFLTITNGLSVKWFAPFRGHLSLNSIQDVQKSCVRKFPAFCRAVDQHRIATKTFIKEEISAFPLESSPQYGDVMLVYFEDGPEIWFRDLNGRWSFLAETFTNYYRMMLCHLGIISWQTIFSDAGVDPVRKPWLYLFIPQRMTLDESER